MLLELEAVGERFYFCPENSLFTFDKEYQSTSERPNVDDMLTKVKMTSYCFCLAISDVCNLHCSYCFNKAKTGKLMKGDEAVADLERLFAAFPDGEKYFIDLSGLGEPLLNLGAIEQIAAFCRRKSEELRVEVLPQLVCNGTLLTEKVAERLQELGVLFGVSLDGERQANDLSRGKGTFDAAINNVRRIKDRRYIGCAATLSRHVFPLKESLDELSKTFKTISYRPARGEGYRIDEQACDGWIREYERLSAAMKEDVVSNNDDRFLTLMNGDDFFGRILCRVFGRELALNRCDAGIRRFAIGVDGMVTGCIPECSLHGGIGLEQSKQGAPRLLEQQAHRCPDCVFRFVCGGPCPIEYEALDGPNPAECRLAKRLIVLAGALMLCALRDNPDLYIRLRAFSKEKRRRRQADKRLYDFLARHPELGFSDGKRAYDDLLPSR